jgi:RNA polymerase sigma factor (TIGR02999 family)
MQAEPGQVTELLQRWNTGDKEALNTLLPIVYQDLRRLARNYLHHEDSAHTLESTALVHEAYLRLCNQRDPKWNDRVHFFAVAARMLRRILIDHARRKSAKKRVNKNVSDPFEEALTVPIGSNVDLIPLDEALSELAKFDLRKCQVVEMRFFSGLTATEIAGVLGTTEATVRRDWNIARAWLYRRMKEIS